MWVNGIWKETPAIIFSFLAKEFLNGVVEMICYGRVDLFVSPLGSTTIVLPEKSSLTPDVFIEFPDIPRCAVLDEPAQI